MNRVRLFCWCLKHSGNSWCLTGLFMTLKLAPFNVTLCCSVCHQEFIIELFSKLGGATETFLQLRPCGRWMYPGGAINRTRTPLIISMLPQALLTLACLRVSSCMEAELHTCAVYKRGCLPPPEWRHCEKRTNISHLSCEPHLGLLFKDICADLIKMYIKKKITFKDHRVASTPKYEKMNNHIDSSCLCLWRCALSPPLKVAWQYLLRRCGTLNVTVLTFWKSTRGAGRYTRWEAASSLTVCSHIFSGADDKRDESLHSARTSENCGAEALFFSFFKNRLDSVPLCFVLGVVLHMNLVLWLMSCRQTLGASSLNALSKGPLAGTQHSSRASPANNSPLIRVGKWQRNSGRVHYFLWFRIQENNMARSNDFDWAWGILLLLVFMPLQSRTKNDSTYNSVAAVYDMICSMLWEQITHLPSLPAAT